jgi:hypothetical protein
LLSLKQAFSLTLQVGLQLKRSREGVLSLKAARRLNLSLAFFRTEAARVVFAVTTKVMSSSRRSCCCRGHRVDK